jgi:hypothetical protein
VTDENDEDIFSQKKIEEDIKRRAEALMQQHSEEDDEIIEDDKIDGELNIEPGIVKKLELEDDPLKKGIGIGGLVFGLYMMDRMLGEEKIIYISENKRIKVKKGFLEEFLE